MTAGTAADRWARRRLMSAALDSLLLVGPLVCGSLALWLLASRTSAWSWGAQVPLLLAGSCAAAAVADRLLRRVLPLATLMRLTMVFPDRAPSRMRVARQAGRPDVLRARLSSGDLDESEAATAILALVAGLSRHDRQTRGHSERVRVYTDMISTQLGLSEHDRDRLRWSALLHDIGKLSVPPSLLNKPRAPSAAEWAVLRAHPQHGASLASSLLPWLGVWGDAIAQHHERFDGGGYPLGLAGDDIAWSARIIAVADSFETMTAVRSYRKAISHRNARMELAACAGTQFDPVVVRAFLEMSLPAVLRAMGPVAALLQLPFAASIQHAGLRAVDPQLLTAAVTAPLLAVSATAGLHVPVAHPTQGRQSIELSPAAAPVRVEPAADESTHAARPLEGASRGRATRAVAPAHLVVRTATGRPLTTSPKLFAGNGPGGDGGGDHHDERPAEPDKKQTKADRKAAKTFARADEHAAQGEHRAAKSAAKTHKKTDKKSARKATPQAPRQPR